MYLDGGQTRRAGSIYAVARSGKFEIVVDSAGTKSTTATRDEVCADFLRCVHLTIVVTGLAVERANTL